MATAATQTWHVTWRTGCKNQPILRPLLNAKLRNQIGPSSLWRTDDKILNMLEHKYQITLDQIDEAHAQDPKKHVVGSREIPYELWYSEKMTKYLSKRRPSASPTLQIAIRAQHLRRWEVPRDSYPMTKPGYHAWRTYLKKRQADLASKTCLDNGLSEDEAERVACLIRKEDLKQDEETQALEDVACLVFLDDQFEDFEKQHDEAKIVTILRKTWVKMSDKGHDLALEIPMSERCKDLVIKALSEV